MVPETPEAHEKSRVQAEALITTLALRCEIRDVALVVSGTSKPAGSAKDDETRVYEVACADGLGYLLESRGTEAPVGLSCFAAEAARLADAAKGKAPGFYCKLPETRDVKAIAATLMAGAGTACAVRELKWFGRSAGSKTEYTEVVCDDGKGFLLRTPLPGATLAASVMGCHDAARQGIKCKMTDPGPLEPEVTLDTFKGALTSNGVACRIDQVREIGQEDVHKRYVVEYLCVGEHNGMVAYVPLAGNENPYEQVSCSVAVTRGVLCILAPLK